MSAFEFTSQSWVSAGVTLDSVASGSGATGSSIANSGGKGYLDISVALGSINPTGSPYLQVDILAEIQAGTDEDATTSTVVRTMLVTTGSSAKAVVFKRIPAFNGDFKIRITNYTGVTLAASGNAVYYSLYDYESV